MQTSTPPDRLLLSLKAFLLLKCVNNFKLNRQIPVPHTILRIPWLIIGADLFELESNNYVITVDKTSNFFNTSILSRKLSIRGGLEKVFFTRVTCVPLIY